MESVIIWSAVTIGVVLFAALVAMVRVLSWLELDEDDAIPEE